MAVPGRGAAGAVLPLARKWNDASEGEEDAIGTGSYLVCVARGLCNKGTRQQSIVCM